MSRSDFQVPPNLPEPALVLPAIMQSMLKLPRAQCVRIIQEGGVKVNGRVRTKAHYVVEQGDKVEVEWLPQPISAKSQGKSKANETFKTVYDDDDIIVVMKPAQMLTVPTMHRERRTLISQVNLHLQKTGTGEEAFCVHRLDRGVSGLLVFAKSIAMAELIRNQFAERKPDRLYVAIVAGTLKKNEGTIRSYLATDSDLNRYSTSKSEESELAITHYAVRDVWQDATLLEVKLETGRRNQIRVHLAENGNPVLGDPRYRPHLAEHWAWPYKRLALHAESLGFRHPRSGEELLFQSSWPQEFKTFQRTLSKSRS